MSRLATGRPRGSTIALIAALISIASTRADDTPLSIADLEAYRAALAAKPGATAPRVGFRELWDHPEAHVGRSVRVEGRVARLFRQPGIGEFPPLAEAWVVSKAGDPFCLVFPIPDRRPVPEIGASVRFAGTFLKRLEYQGGDVSRLAPLIVGPEPPSTVEAASPDGGGLSWSTVDWVMGLGAASMVALILARKHLSRPSPARSRHEPAPEFVDGDPDPDDSIEGGSSDDHAR